MSGCPPLLLQFVRHVPSSKTCKLVIFSKRCSLQHRVLPLPHSLWCCLATAVTCSSQSGKMTFLLPSAMTFLRVENTAACGHYSTPLTYCKRLPQAPRPDPGSLVALWLTTTERSLIWTEQPEVPRWAQRLLSGRAPAVGPLLGTGHPPVPGPLLCHKDGTTAPGHHLSLLLPLQVSAKKWQRAEGEQCWDQSSCSGRTHWQLFPSCQVLPLETQVIFPFSWCQDIVKFSHFGTPFPVHCSPHCWPRPVSIHRVWGRWGSSWQLSLPCFPVPSLVNLASEALHLL